MKPLPKAEIDKLRSRWLEEDAYIRVIGLLKEQYFGEPDHQRKWLTSNSKPYESYRNAYAYNWLKQTQKGMFRELLPLDATSFSWLPTYYNEELGRTLVDLRGISNTNNMFKFDMALLSGVDFSYANPLGGVGFGLSSLVNCVVLKANMKCKDLGFQHEGGYYQDCDFSEVWIRSTRIDNCNFVRCKLRSPQIFRALVRDTLFDACSFRSALFGYGYFIQCAFRNCCFIKADMEYSRFINCVFEDCDWTNVKKMPVLEEIEYAKIDPMLLNR